MNSKKIFTLFFMLALNLMLTACASDTNNISESEKQSLHEKRLYELQRVKERLSKEY